ncbi:MAG: hypothetical protein QME60_01350 [Verrucomicrobiota bacterium]|nr:hypothetical protein [Verrucomicrobiota bacterium]
MKHRNHARFISRPEEPSGGGQIQVAPGAGRGPKGSAPRYGAGNPRGNPLSAASTGTKGKKGKRKGMVVRYGGSRRRKKKQVARY